VYSAAFTAASQLLVGQFPAARIICRCAPPPSAEVERLLRGEQDGDGEHGR
jgi:hypothetical protein